MRPADLQRDLRGTRIADKDPKKRKGDLLRFKVLLFLLPLLARAYFKLLDITCRVVFLNREYEEQVCKKRSFACACFHGGMLLPVYYCRRYSRSDHGEPLLGRGVDRPFVAAVEL